MNQEIVDFIKTNLKKGVPLDKIELSLIRAGWKTSQIKDAVAMAQGRMPPPRQIQEPFHPQPEKHMQKHTKELLIVIIILVLIIGGGYAVYNYDGINWFKGLFNRETEGLVDCGKTSYTLYMNNFSLEAPDNFDCFIDAAETCSPARLEVRQTSEIFGIHSSQTEIWELRETETDKCEFFLEKKDISIEYGEELIQNMMESSGMTREEILQQLNANTPVGATGSCKFDTQPLQDMLGRWKSGNFSVGISCSLGEEPTCTPTGDWEVAEDCQGDYFNPQMSG